MLGILAGAAVGFALGMALAPKKGSDFRQDITDTLDDLGNRVADLLGEGRSKLAELARMKGVEINTDSWPDAPATSKKAVI